jgi:uncharacterized membrane protein (UPF0127 family)
MKKKLFYILLLIITSLLITVIISCQQKKVNTVTINNIVFNTEIADTKIKQTTGLSNRSYLETNQGMLFIFPKPDYYQFVMREMNFPLDIIFINNDEIVDIKKNLEPEGVSPQKIYSPSQTANKILEINSGLSDLNNFSIGDKLFFSEKTSKNYCLLLLNMLKFR